jgi:glutamate dehydrogenase
VVTKANTRSTVHRDGYTDYIGVKRYDAQGAGDRRAPLHRPVHVHRLRLARDRDAAAAAQGGGDRQRAGFSPGGHLAKALQHTLETFRATTCSRSRTRSCTTPRWASWRWASGTGCACSSGSDPFDRFVSCLVFVPREASPPSCG